MREMVLMRASGPPAMHEKMICGGHLKKTSRWETLA